MKRTGVDRSVDKPCGELCDLCVFLSVDRAVDISLPDFSASDPEEETSFVHNMNRRSSGRLGLQFTNPQPLSLRLFF